jgi:hypothetical protein
MWGILQGGPDGMESPPSYNIIDHGEDTHPPEGAQVTDEDAMMILRHGTGIRIPPAWIAPGAASGLDNTSLTFMHSFKLGTYFKRHLFMRWWFSLPCLK